MLLNLDRSSFLAQSYSKYNPSKGYWWQFKGLCVYFFLIIFLFCCCFFCFVFGDFRKEIRERSFYSRREILFELSLGGASFVSFVQSGLIFLFLQVGANHLCLNT